MVKCKYFHAVRTNLPGYWAVVPGVALQVGAAQPQFLLQLLPQFFRWRLQPELLLGELERHHSCRIRHNSRTQTETQKMRSWAVRRIAGLQHLLCSQTATFPAFISFTTERTVGKERGRKDRHLWHSHTDIHSNGTKARLGTLESWPRRPGNGIVKQGHHSAAFVRCVFIQTKGAKEATVYEEFMVRMSWEWFSLTRPTPRPGPSGSSLWTGSQMLGTRPGPLQNKTQACVWGALYLLQWKDHFSDKFFVVRTNIRGGVGSGSEVTYRNKMWTDL